MEQRKRLEDETSHSKAELLTGLVKRIPAIWALRVRAVLAEKVLPSYEGEVPLPGAEQIFSWIEGICTTPHRRPGSAEGLEGEKWVAKQLREIGLEDVTMEPMEVDDWSASEWSLTVEGRQMDSFFVVSTGFTPAAGVAAPLAYVGTGKRKAFERIDVRGKIVVADVTFPRLPYGILLKFLRVAYAVSDPEKTINLFSKMYLNFARENFIGGMKATLKDSKDVYWQAYHRGAVGLALIMRDQPSNSNTHYGPYDGILKPVPALWVGKYDGQELRKAAARGAEARLVLKGRIKPGVMHNVWGVLPGKSDEVILVTSHHDSPFLGAVEDGSGIAQVLTQAYAWSKVPQEQRPRTLIFVIDAGHFYGSLGAHRFALDHPDIMERTKILLTLEHLAAKEVIEVNREYAETGRLALTVMFTSNDVGIIAAVKKAFRKIKPKRVASIPADFFGPAPTSDAAGYVLESGVPVVSWIGCPYYLLDQHDTLNKIDKNELVSVAETVTELVKNFMVLK